MKSSMLAKAAAPSPFWIISLRHWFACPSASSSGGWLGRPWASERSKCAKSDKHLLEQKNCTTLEVILAAFQIFYMLHILLQITVYD